MDILIFNIDNLIEIIKRIVLIVAIIGIIYSFVKLFLDNKEKSEDNNLDEEIENDYEIQKAIIMIGDEKIKIEVDDYDIEDTIIKIETKDEKLYLTDIKNVLLISE
ncbi:hypothetical protein [Clostridium perfringens]|uniref:hypothetical protein n=1 Tax=Clostridium perfringens TaxID=1502 RepID=UPI003754D8B5